MKHGDHAVAIAAQVIESEAEIKQEMSLEDRLRAAMGCGRDHWMVTDEDERFRASVGAVLLSANEDERERIAVELRGLRDLSALLNGVPVDVTRIERQENPIGLMRIWKEQHST